MSYVSSSLAPWARRQQRDVVGRAALPGQAVDDRVADALHPFAARALDQPAEPLQPGVERLAADLDDAVGVEHERRAGREVALPLAVARRARDPERDVRIEVQEARAPV